MNRVRDISFKYRLLTGFLLVALVPMLIGNFLIIQVFHSSIVRQASETAERQVNELDGRLDELYHSCETISARIAGDEQISRALVDRSYRQQSDVNLSLYRAAGSLPEGSLLSLYDAGGQLRYTTDETLAAATLPLHWGVLHKAQSSGEMAYYNAASQSGGNSQFLLITAQRVYSSNNLHVGYVVLSLSPRTFHSLLSGVYSDQGAVFVLNAVGEMVYSSLSAFPSSESGMLRRHIFLNGNAVLERDDDQYYIRQNRVSGFYVVLRHIKPLTFSSMKTIREVSALMGALSLTLCILFSLVFSRGLSQPIQALREAMDQAKTGRLNVRLDVRGGDELGTLAADFNRMAEELQEYMYKIVRQQREMEQSRTKLLQAQLNPHFLYNTLDTIKWLAKLNHLPVIADISNNLAIILRQCVSRDEFVTLSEEMAMIQSYIDIQRIRFSERFEYSHSIPPELRDCIIPKLILQPIVENAILHGLADSERGYLYIRAELDNENALLISVTDDGCGMTEEAINRLHLPQAESEEVHLGLYNVSQILLALYGEGYGLQASAVNGVGTTVRVRTPARRGNNADA